MKIVNIKLNKVSETQKASRPEYLHRRNHSDVYDIDTIEKLEEFIKNTPIKLGRNINDFIKFNQTDRVYLEQIVKSNDIFYKIDVLNKIFKPIFKYNFKTCVGYWTCRGHSEEDAKQKISDLQKITSNVGHIKKHKDPNYKKKLTTHIEYWLAKGFSYTESKQKLKERQRTFTLDKCIEKHGIEEGTRIYKARQDKWINSLYDGKTPEQIANFEKSKIVNFCRASGESLKVFVPLMEWLSKEFPGVKYKIGYGENSEYSIFDNESSILFNYDFTIPDKKLIIEFNGHVWHPNGKNWKPLHFVKRTAEEIVLAEALKKSVAENAGFRILTIWDKDSQEENLKKCQSFINGFSLT